MHSMKDVIVRHKLVIPGRAMPIVEVNLDSLDVGGESRDEVGRVGRGHIAEIQVSVSVRMGYNKYVKNPRGLSLSYFMTFHANFSSVHPPSTYLL